MTVVQRLMLTRRSQTLTKLDDRQTVRACSTVCSYCTAYILTVATSTRRLCSYMCLSVCMSVNRITHKLLINLCEILWNCWTRCRNQLIRIWIRIQEFLKEFNHCNIGNCKGCSSWVGNSPKMHRLADLRLNKLKAVCTLRGVSVVSEAEALIIII